MSYLGARNAISLGVSYQATLGGPNLLNKLSPSLLLNFTNTSTLDPRITFTRSTTATFTGSDGLIQTAAIDAPRFDYNPTTLASLGLLIEEQRVNLFLQSENFTTTWTVAGTNATITANTTAAPDGTTTADSLTDNDTSGVHRVAQVVTTANTNQTVFSCFVKYSTMQWITLSVSTSTGAWAGAKFDVQNGVLGSISQQGASWTANSSAITPVGNGWYRCVLVYTPGASGSTVAALSGATDGTTFTTSQRGSQVYAGTGSVVFLWGAQLEAGAFATSYIPTVASQVTRAADVAVMTGTNFSSWYNATEGTFFAEWTLGQDFMAACIYQADDGTGSNLIRLRYSVTGASNDTAVIVGGVVQCSLNVTSQLTLNTTYKNAMAYKVNDFARSASGATAITDTSGTIPTVTQFGIGRNQASSEQPNCTIRQLAYYPRRLANAELQGITR